MISSVKQGVANYRKALRAHLCKLVKLMKKYCGNDDPLAWGDNDRSYAEMEDERPKAMEQVLLLSKA